MGSPDLSGAPSRRYYRAMHGRWRGRLTLVIRDAAALASLSFLDRTLWRLTALSERLFGPPWMETRVDCERGAANDEVVHETALKSFGMPLAWGRETITLEADGRRFVLRGRHRFAWAPWTTRTVEGPGEVRQDARGARYVFRYLGAEITQTTERDGEDALVVVQTTRFGESRVRLERLR